MSAIDVRKPFEDAFADQIKLRIAGLFQNLASGQSLAVAEAEFRKGLEEMKQAYESAETILTQIFA